MIDEDRPIPRRGEARVSVLAAGVSAYDLMFRRTGALPGTPRVPFTLGEDVVGIVDALGDDVAGVELGQMVAAPTFSLGVGGGYTESICLAAGELAPVPSGVDPAQAICVVVNYLTAYTALHRVASVHGGERVLIHGAAGGVGSALLDLGRHAGLEMYGTASAYNRDVVESFGAAPIDYRNEDFVQRVQELTGDGVDVAFDPIGGARHVWRSYKALRRRGRLVWFGIAASKKQGLGIIPSTLLTHTFLKLIPDGKKVLDMDLEKDNPQYRQTLVELLDLLAAGELEPIVAERVPLSEAARAHALLEKGGYAGKVVLVVER